MLKNYIKVAYRNFIQNKSFTLLSVLSLTIAITSVILIGMYAKQEFSYDRFHEKADHIYRLTTTSVNQDTERTVGFVPLPLAAHLKENFPGVINFARVWEYRRSMPVSNPESSEVYYEDNFGWAEDTFFDIFDFKITVGDRENPLGDFRSVVISESIAEKYFGDENPVGKTIHYLGETDIAFTVTAVMEEFPSNSHFQFDFIGNIKVAADDYWAGGGVGQGFFDDWVNLFVPAYIVVTPGTDLEPILAEASRLENEYFNVPGSAYQVNAQPITDIHLHSRLDVGEWGVNNSAANVYAVMGVGFIVLLLGIFNFINLVTAQAGKRVKEVGLRKTLGGTKKQLMIQHYMESLLLVLTAVLLSFVLVELLQPWVGSFTGVGNTLSLYMNPVYIAGSIGFVALIVLLAGAWPALFISGFSPAEVLKGTFSGRLGGSSLRKILVTSQFALSGALIVCTFVIYQQLQHMKQTELGFADEQVVIIPNHRDATIIPAFRRLKQAYLQNSNVKSVTASSHLMLASYTYTNTFRLEGSEQDYRWERYTVEGDFPETYDIEMIAGRSFRADMPADTNAVILNRKAAEEMGLDPVEAVGRTLLNRSMGTEGTIVGVAEDFHYQTLHESIQPFVLINRPDIIDFISVRISPGNAGATVDFLEETWSQVIPGASFGYYFLDDTFGQLYAQEEQLSSAILGFSFVAIFLACLGLFGLSLFTAERRTKEIGVRKVLGASVFDVVRLLALDFTKLIALALLIAFPASYLIMNGWLNDYAYRIEISWWFFALGALFVIGISWLTVSWHSVRAATANPIQSLKSE